MMRIKIKTAQIMRPMKKEILTMTDITPILSAVIALVSVLITTFLIPYIKRKTTKEQQDMLETWVNIAVYAAEQLIKGSGKGGERKRYVLDFLEKRGLTYDAEAVDAMIEAAVREMKICDGSVNT